MKIRVMGTTAELRALKEILLIKHKDKIKSMSPIQPGLWYSNENRLYIETNELNLKL